MVIAQPCPAIVSFIDIYRPNLLSYLAPADSPILHTVKMIREYYPQYKNHKMAMISPVLPNGGNLTKPTLGDYNVTILSLKNYLEEKRIDILSFPKVNYAGEHAESGRVFFSRRLTGYC
jgi:hypothetical protein